MAKFPARLTIRFLVVAAETLCFDYWEEHPGHVHTSSLAAVAAGLRDAGLGWILARYRRFNN